MSGITASSMGDVRSLVYLESEAAEKHYHKMEVKLQAKGPELIQILIDKIKGYILSEGQKILNIQQSGTIPKAKRNVLIGRHTFLVDNCKCEMERLQMQREEAISITMRFLQDEQYLKHRVSTYKYLKEYQGCTQKQKIRQRTDNVHNRSSIDDIIEGSGEVEEIMKTRNAFIWQRNKLTSRLISQGGDINCQEFKISNNELKGDVLSVVKTLELVESICRRKSAATLQTGEDIDHDLLLECSKHIGYSLQFLRYLWNLFQEYLNNPRPNKLGQTTAPSNNVEDITMTREFEEEELFDHIIVLLKQLFASFSSILRVPQASCRPPCETVPNGTTSFPESRRSSLNSFASTNNIFSAEWSWGNRYEFVATASDESETIKYTKIVENPVVLFSDSMVCEELVFWSQLVYQCKAKSWDFLHRTDSLGHLDLSYKSSIHDSLMCYNPNASQDCQTKVIRYESILQRVLYQGSPIVRDLMVVCYNFIVFMSSLESSNQGFNIPLPIVMSLITSTLTLSEYIVKKVSLSLMSAHEDSVPMGNIAITNIDYLRSIDDEVVISNQIVSACFSAGIICRSSLEILELGLEFTHSRRDNYLIQVSWMNSVLMGALCIIEGGYSEEEVSEIIKLKQERSLRKRISRSSSFINKSSAPSSRKTSTAGMDIPSSNTESPSIRRKLLKFLHHKSCLRIIEVMNYHRYSLSVQHSGILILRILFRPSFMRRTEIEGIMTVKDFEDIETILHKIKSGSQEDDVENEIERDDQQEQALYMKLIEMSNEDIEAEDEEKLLQNLFIKWRNNLFKKELNVISNSVCDELAPLIQNIFEVNLQYPEIVEQVILIVYELSTTSNFAKFSFIESNILRTLSRVHELHRGNLYLTSLAELCEEVMKDES